MKKTQGNWESSSSSHFITIEGIEGVGKSTAITFIRDWLTEHGLSVVVTREPGGTEVAEEIRRVLLNTHKEPIYPETELLLLFAGRMQHIQEVIKPALQAGKTVLCDRFIDASYAYQGGGRGISDHFIQMLEQEILQGLQPNLTLLLDAPYHVSQLRLQQRSHTDRIESEHEAFFQRVRAKYLKRAEQSPERYRVINAALPLPKVQRQMKEVLHDFF
jgi:dTMP kinase